MNIEFLIGYIIGIIFLIFAIPGIIFLCIGLYKLADEPAKIITKIEIRSDSELDKSEKAPKDKSEG